MPTYEYACDSCNNRFERFQSIVDESQLNCPSCGGRARRLISAGAGVIIKSGKANSPSCGKDVPCCGRETPCGNSGGCH